jgi:hypothetical protein
VWGYRGEEKPRFASSGFSSPLCSATSGAGILKTQVFKKTPQKILQKKSARNHRKKEFVQQKKVPQKHSAKEFMQKK